MLDDIAITNKTKNCDENLGTPWHCAQTFNVFIPIRGGKTWQLIDPYYSVFMRPRMMPTAPAVVGYKTFQQTLTHGDEFRDQFKYIPYYEVSLQPG